jgi:ComF family protein
MFFPSFRYCFKAFSALFFPHNCAGCNSPALPESAGICAQCLSKLPITGYLSEPGNAVEQVFWGRLPVSRAAACCFFTKKSRVQSALHQIKYHFRKDAALQIGEWMGNQLANSGWCANVDLLLPMPLHRKREQERGYNQAALLCNGISDKLNIPTLNHALVRKSATRSQTKQHRAERWENMQGVFAIADPNLLINKHVLLVDDVITTGATLEAMGEILLKVPGLKLSILCFAYTVKH